MILTFGSINVDLIVPVPRLPQPGETVLGGAYELLPGGKGANQALEVPLGETEALIRRLRRRGGRCLLNLAPSLPIDLGLLSEIDLLVANEREAATMSPDPARLARRLRQGLVVTRGAAGASAFLADGSRLDLPALAIVPVDTTGAGDTFVGVLAAALDLGAGLEAALRRAGAAAGLACLARGAQIGMPDASAIDAAIVRLPPA